MDTGERGFRRFCNLPWHKRWQFYAIAAPVVVAFLATEAWNYLFDSEKKRT